MTGVNACRPSLHIPKAPLALKTRPNSPDEGHRRQQVAAVESEDACSTGSQRMVGVGWVLQRGRAPPSRPPQAAGPRPQHTCQRLRSAAKGEGKAVDEGGGAGLCRAEEIR